MSKIEAGRMELEFVELDVNAIIEDALRIVGARAQERRISVERNSGDRLNLRADKRALKQILLNLLSNAVKFTPDKGSITVSAEGDGRVRKIRDRGYRDRHSSPRPAKAWPAFRAGREPVLQEPHGKRARPRHFASLVEIHGGKLEIDSEEGEGTKVTFMLPMGAAPQRQQTAA